jgi:hypothetical protein
MHDKWPRLQNKISGARLAHKLGMRHKMMFTKGYTHNCTMHERIAAWSIMAQINTQTEVNRSQVFVFSCAWTRVCASLVQESARQDKITRVMLAEKGSGRHRHAHMIIFSVSEIIS